MLECIQYAMKGIWGVILHEKALIKHYKSYFHFIKSTAPSILLLLCKVVTMTIKVLSNLVCLICYVIIDAIYPDSPARRLRNKLKFILACDSHP